MHLKISSAKWRPFCPGGDWVDWITRLTLTSLVWSIWPCGWKVALVTKGCNIMSWKLFCIDTVNGQSQPLYWAIHRITKVVMVTTWESESWTFNETLNQIRNSYHCRALFISIPENSFTNQLLYELLESMVPMFAFHISYPIQCEINCVWYI